MNSNTVVPVRQYLGFASKIQRFSKLDLIIEKLESSESDLSSEINGLTEQVSNFSLKNELSDEKLPQSASGV